MSTSNPTVKPSFIEDEYDDKTVADAPQSLSVAPDDATQNNAPLKQDPIKRNISKSLQSIDVKYLHIVFSIPFFSTAAMSMPYVYLSIYLVDVFHTPVGASIQVGEILGSLFNMLAPKLSAVILLFISIGGFSGLLFEETSSNLVAFSLCNVATGVCGLSPYVQIFAKQEWGTDLKKMRKAIPMQWVVNGLGFGFGALIAGLTFDSFGMKGVAAAGLVLQGVSLGSVGHYLCIANGDGRGADDCETDDKNDSDNVKESAEPHVFDGNFFDLNDARNEPEDASNKIEKEQGSLVKSFRPTLSGVPEEEQSLDGTKKSYVIEEGNVQNEELCNDKTETVHTRDVRFTLRSHTVQKWMKESAKSGELRPTLVRNFSEYNGIKKTGFVGILSLMFALESITAGAFLSIGPIFVVQQFGRSESIVGTLLAVSQFSGTITNLLMFTDKGVEFQRRLLPTPYNLYALFILAALFTCFLLVPLFAVQVICVVVIFILNEPLLSTIGEVQGAVSTSKEYATQGPLGNIVNSAFHLVVALVLPKLYDVHPLLPYTVAGAVALLLAISFIWSFQRRIKKNSETLSVFQMRSEDESSGVRISFISQEVLARMVRSARFSRISRISRLSNVRVGNQRHPVDSE